MRDLLHPELALAGLVEVGIDLEQATVAESSPPAERSAVRVRGRERGIRYEKQSQGKLRPFPGMFLRC